MKTVYLQGIGCKPAIRAAELEGGDVTMWISATQKPSWELPRKPPRQ